MPSRWQTSRRLEGLGDELRTTDAAITTDFVVDAASQLSTTCGKLAASVASRCKRNGCSDTCETKEAAIALAEAAQNLSKAIRSEAIKEAWL